MFSSYRPCAVVMSVLHAQLQRLQEEAPPQVVAHGDLEAGCFAHSIFGTSFPVHLASLQHRPHHRGFGHSFIAVSLPLHVSRSCGRGSRAPSSDH